MHIPEGFVADPARLSAFMAEATTRLGKLSVAGFTSEEIESIIVNESHSDTDMALAMSAVHEEISIEEAIVKHVNSRGEVTRTKDRDTRKRNAFKTTGLTASTRRQIARRAAKTKRAQPGIQVRAERKKKKAMKRRKALGLS